MSSAVQQKGVRTKLHRNRIVKVYRKIAQLRRKFSSKIRPEETVNGSRRRQTNRVHAHSNDKALNVSLMLSEKDKHDLKLLRATLFPCMFTIPSLKSVKKALVEVKTNFENTVKNARVVEFNSALTENIKERKLFREAHAYVGGVQNDAFDGLSYCKNKNTSTNTYVSKMSDMVKPTHTNGNSVESMVVPVTRDVPVHQHARFVIASNSSSGCLNENQNKGSSHRTESEGKSEVTGETPMVNVEKYSGKTQIHHPNDWLLNAMESLDKGDSAHARNTEHTPNTSKRELQSMFTHKTKDTPEWFNKILHEECIINIDAKIPKDDIMPFVNKEIRGLYNQPRRLKLQSVFGQSCKDATANMCVVVEQVEDYSPSEETVSEYESHPSYAPVSPNQNESQLEDVVGDSENRTESLVHDNCQLVTSCFPWLQCAHSEGQGCACVGRGCMESGLNNWEGSESALSTENNQTGCFPWRGCHLSNGEEQGHAHAVDNTQPGCSPWCPVRSSGDCDEPLHHKRTWFPRCLQTDDNEKIVHQESTGSMIKCMPVCMRTEEKETAGNTNNSSAFDRPNKSNIIFKKSKTNITRTYIDTFISENKKQYLRETLHVISSIFNENQNANTRSPSSQPSCNPRRTNRTSFRSTRAAEPGTTNMAICSPDVESFRPVPQTKLLTTQHATQRGTHKGQEASQWQRLRFKSPSPETYPVRKHIEKNKEYANNKTFHEKVESNMSNCPLKDFVRNQWRDDEQSGTPDYDERYISSAETGSCRSYEHYGKAYQNEYNNVDDDIRPFNIQNNEYILNRNTSLQSMIGSDLLDDRESTIVSRLFAQDDIREYIESLSDDNVDVPSFAGRPSKCTPFSEHRDSRSARRVHSKNLDSYLNNGHRHDRSVVDQHFEKYANLALKDTIYKEKYPPNTSKYARGGHDTDGYYHNYRDHIHLEVENGYQPHLLNKTSNADEKKPAKAASKTKTTAKSAAKGAKPSAAAAPGAAKSATKPPAKIKENVVRGRPKKNPAITDESDTENTYNIEPTKQSVVAFAPEEDIDTPVAIEVKPVEVEPVSLSEITEEKPKPKKKISRRRKEEPCSDQLSKRDLEKMMKQLIATTYQIGKHIDMSSSEEEDIIESESDVEDAQNNTEPPKDDDLARRQKAFEDALLGYQLARATASQWDEGAPDKEFERMFKKACDKNIVNKEDPAPAENMRSKNKSCRQKTFIKKCIDEDDYSIVEETLSLCKVANKSKPTKRGSDEPVMEHKQKRKSKAKSDTEGEYSLCEDNQQMCKMKNKKPAKCTCTETISEHKRKCLCNEMKNEITYAEKSCCRADNEKQKCQSETVFERKVECTCNGEMNDRKIKRTCNEKKATNKDDCSFCEKNVQMFKENKRKPDKCACDGMENDTMFEDEICCRANSRNSEHPQYRSKTIVERNATCFRNGTTNEVLIDRKKCCGTGAKSAYAGIDKTRGKMNFDQDADMKYYDSTITEDVPIGYFRNRSTPHERISDYKGYIDDISPMSRDYIYKEKERRHTHDDSGYNAQYMPYSRQKPYDPPQRVDKDYVSAYEDSRKCTSGGCQTFEPLTSTQRDAVTYINGVNRSAKNMPYSSPGPFELPKYAGADKYSEPYLKRNATDHRSSGQNMRRSDEWLEAKQSKQLFGKRYSVDDDEISYGQTESICSSADPYSGRSETRPMMIKKRIEQSRPDKANKRLQCEFNILEKPKVRSSYDYEPDREPRLEYNVPKYTEYDNDVYKRSSNFRPSTSLGIRSTKCVQNCSTQCHGERCVIESRSTTYTGPPRRGPTDPMICTNKKCQIGIPTRLAVASGNDFMEDLYERRTFCKNENRAKIENCCQKNTEGVKETPVVHIHYRARPNICAKHPHQDLARMSNGRCTTTADAPCTPNDKASMKQQIAGILEHTKNIQKAAQAIHRNRKEGEGKDGGAFVHCYNGNCSSLELKRIIKCTGSEYDKNSEGLKSQTRGTAMFHRRTNSIKRCVQTMPQPGYNKNHEFVRRNQLKEIVPQRKTKINTCFDSTCASPCPYDEGSFLRSRCPSDRRNFIQMKEIEQNLEFLKESTKPFKRNMAKLSKLLLREPINKDESMNKSHIHNIHSGFKTGHNFNMNANSNGSNEASSLTNVNDNAKSHKKVSFTINNSSQNMAKSSVYLSLSPKRVSVTVSKNGDRVNKTMLLRSVDNSKHMQEAKQQHYSIAEPYEETLQYLRTNEMELSSSYKDQKRNYKSRPLLPCCRINSVLDKSIRTNHKLVPKMIRNQPDLLRPQCSVNKNKYVHATLNPKSLHTQQENITGNRCEQMEQHQLILDPCQAKTADTKRKGYFDETYYRERVLSKQHEKSCITTVKMDNLGAKEVSPIATGDDSKSSAYGIEDIPYDQQITKNLHVSNAKSMKNKRKKTKQHKSIIADRLSMIQHCESRPPPFSRLKDSTNNVFSQTETNVSLMNVKGSVCNRHPLSFHHRAVPSPPQSSPTTLSSSSVELESHILTPTKYKLYNSDDIHTIMMREKGTQTPTQEKVYASTYKQTWAYPSTPTIRFNDNIEHRTHGMTTNKDSLDVYTRAKNVRNVQFENEHHRLALTAKTKSKMNVKHISDKSFETRKEYFKTDADPHKNKTYNIIPNTQENSLGCGQNSSILQNHLISWWNSDKSLEQRKLLKHLLDGSKQTHEDTATSNCPHRAQSTLKKSRYNNSTDHNKASAVYMPTSITPASRRPLPLPRNHMTGIPTKAPPMKEMHNVQTLRSSQRKDTKVPIKAESVFHSKHFVPGLRHVSPPSFGEASTLRHCVESVHLKNNPDVTPQCLKQASGSSIQDEPDSKHRDARASQASDAPQQCSLSSAGSSPQRKRRSRHTRHASSPCEKKNVLTSNVENQATEHLETTSYSDRSRIGEAGNDDKSKCNPIIESAVVEDDWHQHRVAMGSIVEANENRVVIEGFYTLGISDQEKDVHVDTSTNNKGKFPMKRKTVGFRIVLFAPGMSGKIPKVTGTYMCEMDSGKFFKWRVQSIVASK